MVNLWGISNDVHNLIVSVSHRLSRAILSRDPLALLRCGSFAMAIQIIAIHCRTSCILDPHLGHYTHSAPSSAIAAQSHAYSSILELSRPRLRPLSANANAAQNCPHYSPMHETRFSTRVVGRRRFRGKASIGYRSIGDSISKLSPRCMGRD